MGWFFSTCEEVLAFILNNNWSLKTCWHLLIFSMEKFIVQIPLTVVTIEWSQKIKKKKKFLYSSLVRASSFLLFLHTCTILHLPLFEKSRFFFQNFNEMHHQTMKLYIFFHKRSLNQYMMWIRSTQQPTQSAQTAVCSILHHLAWIWNFIKLVGWI